MSKILITGNGFDLFHHLPTKYGHFMAIMETIEKYSFKKELTFQDLFERFFKERFLIDYQSIEENYSTKEILFKKEKILEISKLLQSNLWYKHFLNVNNIDSWIDFENEIENVLIQISVIITYTENKTVGRNNYFELKQLNINVDFSVFNFCIINGRNCFISDEYINSRTDKFDGYKILNELENSLNDFIIIFNKYLSSIVDEFYDNYLNKFKIPLEKIDFFYTFNYTSTINRIYNKSIFLTYLHGQTNQDNVKQNLVLGIDEVPKEVISHKAFGFSKYYQKIINNTNNFLFELPDKNTHISEENIFYIFGHSLDRSDKEHIGRIFKFLENDYTKQSSIVVFYYDILDYKNKLKNLFSFIKKEIIVNFNAEERLVFREINEKNLKKEFNKNLWRSYEENNIQ